ncbi:unnamed protein product [Rotaria socialis]|uniref:Uncharacterized protein n=1 Tax=Rotaria socialis TaxID=392032 RepID=A0A817YQ68_9BILA|nr:unnamed protein product [Rotaria socialis]CAF4752160.1 unnamed protein product [Rotaria socialis]
MEPREYLLLVFRIHQRNTLVTRICPWAPSASNTLENQSRDGANSVSGRTIRIRNSNQLMKSVCQSTANLNSANSQVERQSYVGSASTISSFNDSLAVGYGFIENNNLSKDVTDNYFGASSYIEPGPMFTPYISLIVVNEDEHRRDKFPDCAQSTKFISVPPDSESITCQSQFTNSAPCFIEDTRDTMNRILAEANLSQLRSQARMALQRQSKSGIRRLLSKLSRGAHSLQEKLAETPAPGQGKELLLLTGLEIDVKKNQMINSPINNEVVQNVKEIYDMLWCYEDVMAKFGCSQHAIKTAHQMHDDNEYMLKAEKESDIRQRANPNTIKHFVSWLIESDTLVSGKM